MGLVPPCYQRVGVVAGWYQAHLREKSVLVALWYQLLSSVADGQAPDEGRREEEETVAKQQHSIRVDDEPYEWAVAEAKARGASVSDFIQTLIEGARAAEASTATATAGAPVLQEAVADAMRANVAALTGQLTPLVEALTLETVRGRMTAEEILAYQYDGDNLICPSCKKPYRALQAASSFAGQRSTAILQKAKEALAAGRMPRLRAW